MSLKSLGLDYVDLYLLHWPIAMNPEGINYPSIYPTINITGHDLTKKNLQATTRNSQSFQMDRETLSKIGHIYRHGS
jgi:glycerol 2-dehydrogenase (NADP+)